MEEEVSGLVNEINKIKKNNDILTLGTLIINFPYFFITT